MPIVVGTEDILLSLMAFLKEHPHLQKVGDGFGTRSLIEAIPEVKVLPYGLDIGMDETGPRLGIKLPLDAPDAWMYGGIEWHRWQVFIEGDALQVDADGHPDIPSTNFMLHRLRSHLSTLLPDGEDIPLSLWGDNGPFRTAGTMKWRQPRFHQTGPAEFFLAGRLEKLVDPTGLSAA